MGGGDGEVEGGFGEGELRIELLGLASNCYVHSTTLLSGCI